MRAKILFAAFIFSFLISAAFANIYPPKPDAHFLGDANGDTGITGSDIIQHGNYILSKAYTYDTLQPNNSNQAWNTCDVDSNRGCTGTDTILLNSYLLSKSVSVTDDPWSVNNLNLPLSGNAPATWIPFTIDLHSTFSALPSGRPGVSVVVEIDPLLSTTTGQLAGRECNPADGSRDQATVAFAQCALAVTQTNWPVSTGTGPTESGTYGLQVMGDGNGDLNLKVYTIAIPGLDIPATSTRLVVSFVAADTVALTCPSSVGEDATSSCTITASGGSSCAIGAGTTCTGATLTDCTQIDIAAQGEAAGPGSCVVEVTKGTANDSKTITINEVNINPTITVDCPDSVGELSVTTCPMTVADADMEPQTLTCSLDAATTCTGVTLTGCTTADVPAQGEGVEPRTCTVAVTVQDDFTLPGSAIGSEVLDIVEENQPPSFSSTAPTTATELILYSYTATVTDPDLPVQTLTCSKSASDTCNGALSGTGNCAYSFTPTESHGGTTCVVGLNVSDDGIPVMSAEQNTIIDIAENNQAPSISNLPFTKGGAITKVNSYDVNASDSDLPANTLTFSLGADTCTFSPSIVPSTGVVSWTCGDFVETCTQNVTVTDDGSPVLTDTEALTIICNTDPTLAGTYHLSSWVFDMHVSGGYAYVANWYSGLRVIDISNPSSPTVVGTYDTPGSAIGMYVSGGYAYVADWDSGLQIIDISNPSSPTLVGTYNTPDEAREVYVSGGYAYVADNYSGLQIIDISNPSSPMLVGTYNTPGYAHDVYVSGGYAYVTDGYSGLQIIDISNPSTPTLVGTYNTPGETWGVYVSGGYAYVGDRASGLQVIDISNPSSPTLAGTYDTTGEAWYVYVSGGYAYVADKASGLQVIDISNPSSPTLAGTYDTPGEAWGVHVSDGYAYVGDYVSYDFHIIEVNYKISAPTLAGTYDTPGQAWGVDVSGGYAYVADQASGLQIIDISNPESPTFAGTYDTLGNAYGVYVSGRYAYVADGSYGLQIINVSNPSSPTLVGTCDTPGSAYAVYVSGGYAYVADLSYGLQIINISNPASPTLVGTYDTPGDASGVYVSGGYAYVSDYAYGLQIIDISNPATPTLVGTYDTTGNAYGVYVSGLRAYIADGTYGLQIIDISNPVSPTLEGAYNTAGVARGVYASANRKYAYVADTGAGLQMINISNPASPTLAGTYDTPGNAYNVYISGGYVYLADQASGLQVIQWARP